MTTEEETPVSAPPRTKEQERADWMIRAMKVVVGPLMAAIVALGLGYIQRGADMADATKKADTAIGSVKPTTDELTKELEKLRQQVATVAGAGAANAKLTVEAHEESPTSKRARARSRKPHDSRDPDLLKQVQESVGALQKVKVEAKAPLTVPVVPATVPDKVPDQSKDAGVPSSGK